MDSANTEFLSLRVRHLKLVLWGTVFFHLFDISEGIVSLMTFSAYVDMVANKQLDSQTNAAHSIGKQ